MKSALVGLSFAGAAVAQIVNGVSMVTMTSDSSYATASASSDYYGSSAAASSSDSSYYGNSAPPQATDYASSTSDASYAQYTAPPSSSSYDIYSVMPYESMTAGGYSSLACGYGYTKAYDGSCQAESWVGS